MKYRNPKTGEVFEDIFNAAEHYCENCRVQPCGSCFNNPRCKLSNQWLEAYPAEAARLMGYEVVEDKPRICEVLGVEVGERFNIVGCSDFDSCDYGKNQMFFIDGTGTLLKEIKPGCDTAASIADGRVVCLVWNHPDRIIRKPRFTEDEAAAIRVLYAAGVKHLTRNAMGELEGWPVRPEPAGDAWYSVTHNPQPLPSGMFPSICPGQLASLEGIVGQKENRPNEGAAIR